MACIIEAGQALEEKMGRTYALWLPALTVAVLVLAGSAEAKPQQAFHGMSPGAAALYQSPRPTHAPVRICIWTDPHPSVVFPATGLCAVPHSAVPGSACTCYMNFGGRTGVVQ